jgi:ABC-2 type transport system permease protein
MNYFRILLAFFTNCFTREVQYRGNFVMIFVMDMVWYAVNIAFFQVIYFNTNQIAGYTQTEVMFFLATTFVVDSLEMFFFASNLWILSDLIRKGDYDLVLTKPISPMFYVSFRFFSIGSLLDFGFALGLLVYCWVQLGYGFTLASVLLYMLLVGCGIVVMYSFQMFFGALSFILVNSSSGLQMGFHHLYQFALKPESIYKGAVRFVLMYILPMIVITAVPARLIIRGFEWPLVLWGVICAGLSLFLVRTFFYYAASKYESASS